MARRRPCLYAYGGFQVSIRPSYSGSRGRLWLENGGAYVVANIRGGGEFGPSWHQAGLKMNRQRIYDDLISVAEDMHDRGLTSPRHTGVYGGSNGGLLTGVMYTQRPDLWNAVVSAVPLAGHAALSHPAGRCVLDGRVRGSGGSAMKACLPALHFALPQCGCERRLSGALPLHLHAR